MKKIFWVFIFFTSSLYAQVDFHNEALNALAQTPTNEALQKFHARLSKLSPGQRIWVQGEAKLALSYLSQLAKVAPVLLLNTTKNPLPLSNDKIIQIHGSDWSEDFFFKIYEEYIEKGSISGEKTLVFHFGDKAAETSYQKNYHEGFYNFLEKTPFEVIVSSKSPPITSQNGRFNISPSALFLIEKPWIDWSLRFSSSQYPRVAEGTYGEAELRQKLKSHYPQLQDAEITQGFKKIKAVIIEVYASQSDRVVFSYGTREIRFFLWRYGENRRSLGLLQNNELVVSKKCSLKDLYEIIVRETSPLKLYEFLYRDELTKTLSSSYERERYVSLLENITRERIFSPQELFLLQQKISEELFLFLAKKQNFLEIGDLLLRPGENIKIIIKDSLLHLIVEKDLVVKVQDHLITKHLGPHLKERYFWWRNAPKTLENTHEYQIIDFNYFKKKIYPEYYQDHTNAHKVYQKIIEKLEASVKSKKILDYQLSFTEGSDIVLLFNEGRFFFALKKKYLNYLHPFFSDLLVYLDEVPSPQKPNWGLKKAGYRLYSEIKGFFLYPQIESLVYLSLRNLITSASGNIDFNYYNSQGQGFVFSHQYASLDKVRESKGSLNVDFILKGGHLYIKNDLLKEIKTNFSLQYALIKLLPESQKTQFAEILTDPGQNPPIFVQNKGNNLTFEELCSKISAEYHVKNDLVAFLLKKYSGIQYILIIETRVGVNQDVPHYEKIPLYRSEDFSSSTLVELYKKYASEYYQIENKETPFNPFVTIAKVSIKGIENHPNIRTLEISEVISGREVGINMPASLRMAFGYLLFYFFENFSHEKNIFVGKFKITENFYVYYPGINEKKKIIFLKDNTLYLNFELSNREVKEVFEVFFKYLNIDIATLVDYIEKSSRKDLKDKSKIVLNLHEYYFFLKSNTHLLKYNYKVVNNDYLLFEWKHFKKNLDDKIKENLNKEQMRNFLEVVIEKVYNNYFDSLKDGSFVMNFLGEKIKTSANEKSSVYIISPPYTEKGNTEKEPYKVYIKKSVVDNAKYENFLAFFLSLSTRINRRNRVDLTSEMIEDIKNEVVDNLENYLGDFYYEKETRDIYAQILIDLLSSRYPFWKIKEKQHTFGVNHLSNEIKDAWLKLFIDEVTVRAQEKPFGNIAYYDKEGKVKLYKFAKVEFYGGLERSILLVRDHIFIMSDLNIFLNDFLYTAFVCSQKNESLKQRIENYNIDLTSLGAYLKNKGYPVDSLPNFFKPPSEVYYIKKEDPSVEENIKERPEEKIKSDLAKLKESHGPERFFLEMLSLSKQFEEYAKKGNPKKIKELKSDFFKEVHRVWQVKQNKFKPQDIISMINILAQDKEGDIAQFNKALKEVFNKDPNARVEKVFKNAARILGLNQYGMECRKFTIGFFIAALFRVVLKEQWKGYNFSKSIKHLTKEIPGALAKLVPFVAVASGTNKAFFSFLEASFLKNIIAKTKYEMMLSEIMNYGNSVQGIKNFSLLSVSKGYGRMMGAFALGQVGVLAAITMENIFYPEMTRGSLAKRVGLSAGSLALSTAVVNTALYGAGTVIGGVELGMALSMPQSWFFAGLLLGVHMMGGSWLSEFYLTRELNAELKESFFSWHQKFIHHLKRGDRVAVENSSAQYISSFITLWNFYLWHDLDAMNIERRLHSNFYNKDLSYQESHVDSLSQKLGHVLSRPVLHFSQNTNLVYVPKKKNPLGLYKTLPESGIDWDEVLQAKKSFFEQENSYQEDEEYAKVQIKQSEEKAVDNLRVDFTTAKHLSFIVHEFKKYLDGYSHELSHFDYSANFIEKFLSQNIAREKLYDYIAILHKKLKSLEGSYLQNDALKKAIKYKNKEVELQFFDKIAGRSHFEKNVVISRYDVALLIKALFLQLLESLNIYEQYCDHGSEGFRVKTIESYIVKISQQLLLVHAQVKTFLNDENTPEFENISEKVSLDPIIVYGAPLVPSDFKDLRNIFEEELSSSKNGVYVLKNFPHLGFPRGTFYEEKNKRDFYGIVPGMFSWGQFLFDLYNAQKIYLKKPHIKLKDENGDEYLFSEQMYFKEQEKVQEVTSKLFGLVIPASEKEYEKYCQKNKVINYCQENNYREYVQKLTRNTMVEHTIDLLVNCVLQKIAPGECTQDQVSPFYFKREIFAKKYQDFFERINQDISAHTSKVSYFDFMGHHIENPCGVEKRLIANLEEIRTRFCKSYLYHRDHVQFIVKVYRLLPTNLKARVYLESYGHGKELQYDTMILDKDLFVKLYEKYQEEIIRESQI